MLLALSLAFAAEPSATVPAPEITIPDGVLVLAVDPTDPPRLTVDGKPRLFQKYSSFHADTAFDSIAGYQNGTLAGFSMADASVYIDGVRVDVGGRLSR